MVISNCEITKQDSQVLKPCVMSTNDEEYKVTGQFHTGIDLSGNDIYSVYSGTVVYTGEDESGKCVVVQTGSSFCITYKHLDTVDVRMGQNINGGGRLGACLKYVHVELLQKTNSFWPVRIGSDTWYKQNPEPIFERSLDVANIAQFENMGITEIEPKYPLNTVNDGEINYILSNNKGE